MFSSTMIIALFNCAASIFQICFTLVFPEIPLLSVIHFTINLKHPHIFVVRGASCESERARIKSLQLLSTEALAECVGFFLPLSYYSHHCALTLLCVKFFDNFLSYSVPYP